MAAAPHSDPLPLRNVPLQESFSTTPLSWDGEKMFNVYIYDYCSKRGFTRTAQELMTEAELDPDMPPPIDARQGLLFEWWSVFWVLFTAKSNNTGPEDALLYTQHQAHQQLQRHTVQRMAVAAGQGIPMNQPSQHQPSVGRLPNGVGPRPYPPNGPLPNGVNPVHGTMHATGQGPSVPTVNSTQHTGYQPLLHGQRPLSTLSQQQSQQLPSQRASNGTFHSPNIEDSPQIPSNQQQPAQPSQSQPHPQPPMSQLGGSSPHLPHMSRPGMGQAINSMNIQQSPLGQNNSPTPGAGQYPQSAGPPSRTGTPRQGGLINHSPSMQARQPTSGMGQMNAGEVGLPPIPVLHQIKVELGMQDRENSSLTPADKQRIMISYQQKQQKSGCPMPDNAVPGPSAVMRGSNQAGQRNPTQQQPRNPQPTQMQQMQRTKRGSNSPGEEDMVPQNDSSPPDRKRLRRSPSEQNAQPMPYPQGLQQPQQSGIPQSVMMSGSLAGRGGGPMMGMNGGHQQSGHPMGGAILGGMSMAGVGGGQMPMTGSIPSMGPSGAMVPHMQNQQMQARTQQLMVKPTGPMGAVPGNSPPSTDSFSIGPSMGLGPSPGPGFNPGVVPNRIGQKIMMPPPSPAMNGVPKDQAGTPKNPMSMESPRNLSMSSTGATGHTPNANGGPSTPVPLPPSSQNQNPGGSGPNPQALVGVALGGPTPMASSPPSTLGGPSSMNASTFSSNSSLTSSTMDASIFDQGFITSVAKSLDDFDPSILSNTDFSDFGQWLNPEGLDPMK